MTVYLLIQCVFFIFIAAAGGKVKWDIQKTDVFWEHEENVQIFQYAEMWIQTTNQSPKPNLARDKSLTCALLGINGPSSRSRVQRSHMLQSALQGTQHWNSNITIQTYPWRNDQWTQQKTNRFRAHLEVHNPVDSCLDSTILEGRTSAEVMWKRIAL